MRSSTRFLKVCAAVLGAGVLLMLPLAIPPGDPVVPPAPPGATAFRWENDTAWRALESRFDATRAAGCADSSVAIRAVDALDRRIAALAAAPRAADDSAFAVLEREYFALAPAAASCATVADRYVASYGRMREMVKRQSTRWDFEAKPVRDRMYRALYGGRAAVEEVMLQHGDRIPTLLAGVAEASSTPSATVHGVTLHSGDILVSRGGYPTSALIARGNDYPGNFSHIALVQIDPATRAVTAIEAHIELGVALATAEEYLASKKLRVMVLRPRADLPALVTDPMLPHKAATAMLARAQAGHIPYDFAMDYGDASKLFCSEVASQAYRAEGMTLWTGISTISNPGLRTWLASFGVVNFATQEPSDLEYDPQLTVVAEWRDPASLLDDHIANAVTDVMLEGAERGDRLTYDWHELPLARVVKGWSWVKQLGGGIGPIPEGMAPASALRNRRYGAVHAARVAAVTGRVEEWRRANGYVPPYWVLLDLAREAQVQP